MSAARLVLAAVLAVLLVGACIARDSEGAGGRTVLQGPHEGRLTARPGSGGIRCTPGLHTLKLGTGRTALMRVTPRGQDGTRALIVVLHGAGGSSGDGLWAFRGGWSIPGLVLVAPSAAGTTWSVLRGNDSDLPSVNLALARAYARCRIDRRKIGVGGFSDGATYALSLGLSNGDLFRAVMALSPGGTIVERQVGRPRFFISHGTRDNVLPISRTSDVIVRKLRAAGYRVTYRKFVGGHEAPERISRAAVQWFLPP